MTRSTFYAITLGSLLLFGSILTVGLLFTSGALFTVYVISRLIWTHARDIS